MTNYVDHWNGHTLVFNSPEEMDEKKRSDYVYECIWCDVIYKFKTEAEIAPFISHLERRKKEARRIIERVEQRKKKAKEVQEEADAKANAEAEDAAEDAASCQPPPTA